MGESIIKYFAGLDIGSVTTKAVIMDENGRIESFAMLPTSYDRNRSGQEGLDLALSRVGMSRNAISRTVSTGYGRKSFKSADSAMPEIVCHGRGTRLLFPTARTIIDIGGQDSKAIEMDEEGNIIRFEMNDKCAAGTGRFLEVLTDRILNIPIGELGPLSSKATRPCILSSVCTVFAESEIVSYLSEGKSKEDIVCGMHQAIAKRVVNMCKAGLVTSREPIVFSGGVARNIGVVKALEEELGKTMLTPDEPQITAALGAAIFAGEYVG